MKAAGFNGGGGGVECGESPRPGGLKEEILNH